MKKVNERDNMFEIMEWEKYREAYEEYYSDNREDCKCATKIEDYCEEKAKYYDEINSKIADAAYDFLREINNLPERNLNNKKVQITSKVATKRIKGIARFYGANLVGITKMKDEFYYSDNNRKEKCYDNKVIKKHKYAIVFAVEMDKDMINTAPLISEVIETSKAQVEVSVIGVILSHFIKDLGYDAVNHMDANYTVISQVVAESAGIGQLGKNGMLVTKKYGARVRVGVVTTDLELDVDGMHDFGLKDFCEKCDICISTCPANAIKEIEEKDVDACNIDQKKCNNRCKSIGTDCGICISTCPFSQGLHLTTDIETFKGDTKLIENTLKSYKKIYPTRPTNKNQPEWIL